MKKTLKRLRDTSIVVFFRLVELVKNWKAKPQPEIVVLDLSPRYEPKVHKVYVDILEDALRDKGKDEAQAKNIALSGSYGVGKSSILDEVKRRHKKQTISISLATLGFPETSTSDPASTTTNVIQKEIVKQILYSEHPAKMSGSQYRRVAKVQKWRTLGHAVVIGFALTLVFFVVDWTTQIKRLIPDIPHIGNSIYVTLAICWLVLATFVFWVLCEIHNRFHIEQLSADKAGFTLSAGTATFFDEYLDEIVYFFEVADKCDIVIFEDIDRFGDHEIFETLRSLNTILNTAKQLKGRSIRFVYAVKDSIFESDALEYKDAAKDEVTRANRTKFFDLIIPVVPFVTHTSARNLLDGVMQDTNHKVSSGLIDLVARHIPDMRLIKNIRNEFAIFKNQILDDGNLNLSQNGLFAIVAYKNIHLKDFELARFGKSDLDAVYQAYRDTINSSTTSLNSAISGYENELRALSSAKNKGNEFGTKFMEDIARTMTRSSGTRVAYQYQGAVVTDEEILTDAFWNKLAEDTGAITVTYRTQYSTSLSFDVTHDELVKIVGGSLDAEKWKKDERQRLNKLIDDAKKDIEFLRSADMRELYDRPKFKHDAKSFGEVLGESLRSELAIELVREGYIDRNFTLYTSIFNGTRVSANAMNFIMKNIDSGVIDASFELTDDDVKSLVRERPDAINQKTAYNINMVDYLLVNEVEKAGKVINQLTQNGAKEQSFINVYLESGDKKREFIAALTGRWPSIFMHLVSLDMPLSDKDRVALVDIALRNMSSLIAYSTNNTLKDFVEKNYKELDVLRSTKTTANQAVEIAALFNHATIEIDDLAPLGQSVKSSVVSVEAYKINRANILLALGDQKHSLSLNDIKSTSDVVYHHILDDVASYLKALDPEDKTITAADHFNPIILEILSADSKSLDIIVERSDSSCIVESLPKLSSDTWAILAKHKRFPVSFENVNAYIIDQIGVDEAITSLLAEAGAISAVDGAEEAAKIALAEKILPASGHIPPAELRANIVASLKLESPLASDIVPNEDGELIGWLIDKRIVADAAETFTHIDANDTYGLLFAISKSVEFKNFMSTTEITALNVDKVLHSDVVPKAVKNVITKDFTSYTSSASKEVLESAAQYAVDSNSELLLSTVARLASEGVSAQLVVHLLQPHFTSITLADITPILVSLGGGYAELAERSYKRPRFNHDDAHRKLLECMQRLDTVSSMSSKGSQLQAFMRHPATVL